MPNYGSSRCVDCGGEDCVCCSVYLEQVADSRYGYDDNHGPYEMEDFEWGGDMAMNEE